MYIRAIYYVHKTCQVNLGYVGINKVSLPDKRNLKKGSANIILVKDRMLFP